MTYHRLESLRPYFNAWNAGVMRARTEYRVWPIVTGQGVQPKCVTGCGRGVQAKNAGKPCRACEAAIAQVRSGHASGGDLWENDSGATRRSARKQSDPDSPQNESGSNPRYNSTEPRSEG